MSIYNLNNIKAIYSSLDDMGKLCLFRDENIEELQKRKVELQKLRKDEEISSMERDSLSEEIDIINREIENTRENVVKPILKDLERGRISLNLKSYYDGEHLMFQCDDLHTILALQLVKEDLKWHYKVQVANRDYVIRTLKMILANQDFKIIIRADIKSFFESIPLSASIEKLERDSYVSPITTKCLHILDKKITEINRERIAVGQPRGLSISSHLSELYMNSLDKKIKAIQGVYFYQRYVDDIVIVANPKLIDPKGLVQRIRECVDEYDLRLHNQGEKWKLIDTSDNDNYYEFEYLGYRFEFSDDKLRVGLSSKRISRYKRRIDAIFDYYNRNSHRHIIDEEVHNDLKQRKDRAPIRQLFDLLTALTGNGMIKGSKSFIPVGVYFSNKHITDTNDLNILDEYLCMIIDERFHPGADLFNYNEENNHNLNVDRLREVLKKWSFIKGFKDRRRPKRDIHYLQGIELLKRICHE